MSLIDIIILAVATLGVARGYFIGFGRVTGEAIAVILSGLVGLYLGPVATPLVRPMLAASETTDAAIPMGALVGALTVFIVMVALLAVVARIAFGDEGDRDVSRGGGLVGGALFSAALLVTLLSMAEGSVIPSREAGMAIPWDEMTESSLVMGIADPFVRDTLLPALTPVLPAELRPQPTFLP